MERWVVLASYSLGRVLMGVDMVANEEKRMKEKEEAAAR